MHMVASRRSRATRRAKAIHTLLKEGAQSSLSGTDLRVPVSCHVGTRQPYNCGKQLLISVSLDIVLLLFMCMHVKSPPSPDPGTKLYRWVCRKRLKEHFHATVNVASGSVDWLYASKRDNLAFSMFHAF